MKKSILIVGASGIGKTTLCTKYCNTHEDVKHIVASSHTKYARELEGGSIDQVKLTQSIRHQIELENYRVFLIDGHLIINNSRVSVDAISKLKLDAIIFLSLKPELIQERRLGDTLRNRSFEDIADIYRSQKEEHEHSIRIAKDIGAPIYVLENATPATFDKAISNILL